MGITDYPMTKPVAERRISAVESDGRSRQLRVEIGTPAPEPEAGGDWYCPIRLTYRGKERIYSFVGIDSLQALHFALGLLELQVKGAAGNAVLSWMETNELFLRPWSPEESGD